VRSVRFDRLLELSRPLSLDRIGCSIGLFSFTTISFIDDETQIQYNLHMTWEIVFHREFEVWFFDLDVDVQTSIAMVLDVLEEQGATLGRPYVDTLKGSILTNMKELRVQHDGDPYRILFAFDPQRQAVLLVGGNKRGDKRWYEVNIPIAERLFKDYLEETSGGEFL
jgi:hypothetical protein